jgi:hypothetical protein
LCNVCAQTHKRAVTFLYIYIYIYIYRFSRALSISCFKSNTAWAVRSRLFPIRSHALTVNQAHVSLTLIIYIDNMYLRCVPIYKALILYTIFYYTHVTYVYLLGLFSVYLYSCNKYQICSGVRDKSLLLLNFVCFFFLPLPGTQSVCTHTTDHNQCLYC